MNYKILKNRYPFKEIAEKYIKEYKLDANNSDDKQEIFAIYLIASDLEALFNGNISVDVRSFENQYGLIKDRRINLLKKYFEMENKDEQEELKNKYIEKYNYLETDLESLENFKIKVGGVGKWINVKILGYSLQEFKSFASLPECKMIFLDETRNETYNDLLEKYNSLKQIKIEKNDDLSRFLTFLDNQVLGSFQKERLGIIKKWWNEYIEKNNLVLEKSFKEIVDESRNYLKLRNFEAGTKLFKDLVATFINLEKNKILNKEEKKENAHFHMFLNNLGDLIE